MYEVNEQIVMKKPHPCGGKEWVVVAVGAEVKLRCLRCGRFLNLSRDELKKRLPKKAEHAERNE